MAHISIVLPYRIRRYRISKNSPTEELLILGQIYAEVGDYASSMLDREHLSVAKFCAYRLRKVIPILVNRRVIATENDIYAIPDSDTQYEEFGLMSIHELYCLYRSWPLRHGKNAEGDNKCHAFDYEDSIIRELATRRAQSKSEQFKIDYCTLTYRNELDNLASLSVHHKYDVLNV